jgi:uncharacterized protein
VTENYLGTGGRPFRVLEQIRRDHPVALHGVAMNLGSVDPLDERYVLELEELVSRVEPFIVSDHLCWSAHGGQQLHDLLPLPYTEEAVAHVAERVSRIQDRLGRRILVENVSSYLEYSHSEMSEWEFLRELCRRSDCGLLLDVNNVYVSSVNHGFDPLEFLEQIPVSRVGQIHLAGHSRHVSASGESYLIDTHDHPVCDEVWELYAQAVKRFGAVNAMIERDDRIPSFGELHEELMKAKTIQERVLAITPGIPAVARQLAQSRGAAGVDALDHHRA